MRTFGALREKIRNLYGTQKSFALSMGMNVATLNGKLNGRIDWTLSEIEKACALLEISVNETKDYFFYAKSRELPTI